MATTLKRHLIISFSVIIVSVIIATCVLYILSDNIAAQVTKVQADRALVSEQTDALDVLSDLTEQAPQAAAYQSAIDQLLPDQDGLLTFQEWLANIASSHQVSANATFAGNPSLANGSQAGQSNFSLEVDGSVDNIIAFLDDIEAKSPGFLVQLSSFNLVTSNGSYKFTAPGVVFFRP